MLWLYMPLPPSSAARGGKIVSLAICADINNSHKKIRNPVRNHIRFPPAVKLPADLDREV
jgi:hypothetical protein